MHCRSIKTDLGAAQRTVLHSVVTSQVRRARLPSGSGFDRVGCGCSQEAHANISQRHEAIQDQLPREDYNYKGLVASIKDRFESLRAVVSVLEAAVLEQAQLCHEDNVAKLKEEMGTCAALENELATNLGITRDFVWAEDQRDVRAPPKVARSDMRLAEIAEMSLEQAAVQPPSAVLSTDCHFLWYRRWW